MTQGPAVSSRSNSTASNPTERSRWAALAVVVGAATALAGCGDQLETGSSGAPAGPQRLEMNGPEVIQDTDGSGVDASKRFFTSSETVVVASPNREDQLRAAALAVELGAPLLVRNPGAESAVDAEITRLGATRVIDVPGDTDPEDAEAIQAAQSPETAGGEVAGVVAQSAQHPIDLVLPPVLATPETSLAAAATARAAGAEVMVLTVPDPRETQASMQTVTGQDTLALGRQWGSDDAYRERIALAAGGELPGGGGLVFPGRRMVALYGHPSGPALGLLGEQGPAEAAELAKQYASWYQPLDAQPVVPAFEVIATVASDAAGPDGNFSNETDPTELVPYTDAITEAGGYAVLDLQPGQGSFLEQAKLYQDLLMRPNVGLALDAEWKLNPGEQPLSRIGSASAAEINEVADWLAALVRDNGLPQKVMILHQFQSAMYPDRENIRTGQPELAWVLHADGHGTPELKFETWDVLREGLDPAYFMAWKNFIDEDTPTFTPEQTYETVNPRPWFVSYQ